MVRFHDIGLDGESRNDLYSFPLGFVRGKLMNQDMKAVIDSGSQVNLISLEQAHEWEIPNKDHDARVSGIGQHGARLVGVAEDVMVTVAGIKSTTHFFVAYGPVQLVLGRPLSALVLSEKCIKDNK